jgi:hypothetical protein
MPAISRSHPGLAIGAHSDITRMLCRFAASCRVDMNLTKSLREKGMFLGVHLRLVTNKYDGMIGECLEKFYKFFSGYFGYIDTFNLRSYQGVRGSIVKLILVLRLPVNGFVLVNQDGDCSAYNN